jgi:SAM-dependent methyltransferase
MQRAGGDHALKPGGPARRAAAPRGDAQALAQYRRRATFYDDELAPFEPWRREAVQRLALRPGDRVLDVGCGTGLSFQPIEDRVGAAGRIVGVEQCPEMLARARQRVRQAHWANVRLVCAPAGQAPIAGRADAALFHFTHDILRDDAALDHVARHLKPGARVVATGLQWAPPWAWPVNAFVALAAMYSTTSFEGLARPWDKLAARLTGVQVSDSGLGGLYIASGRLR